MAYCVIKGSGKVLKALFNRLHFYLLKEDIIQADETVLSVLDEKDNKNNYLWFMRLLNEVKSRFTFMTIKNLDPVSMLKTS